LLLPGLIASGCFKSANELIGRALNSFPDSLLFATYREHLATRLRVHFQCDDNTLKSRNPQDYPDKGSVRRERYPWNEHEPKRVCPESIRFLNEELSAVAAKLEVKAVSLPILLSHDEPAKYVVSTTLAPCKSNNL
jgi:hypothetical protein